MRKNLNISFYKTRMFNIIMLTPPRHRHYSTDINISSLGFKREPDGDSSKTLQAINTSPVTTYTATNNKMAYKFCSRRHSTVTVIKPKRLTPNLNPALISILIIMYFISNQAIVSLMSHVKTHSVSISALDELRQKQQQQQEISYVETMFYVDSTDSPSKTTQSYQANTNIIKQPTQTSRSLIQLVAANPAPEPSANVARAQGPSGNLRRPPINGSMFGRR